MVIVCTGGKIFPTQIKKTFIPFSFEERREFGDILTHFAVSVPGEYLSTIQCSSTDSHVGAGRQKHASKSISFSMENDVPLLVGSVADEQQPEETHIKIIPLTIMRDNECRKSAGRTILVRRDHEQGMLHIHLFWLENLQTKVLTN